MRECYLKFSKLYQIRYEVIWDWISTFPVFVRLRAKNENFGFPIPIILNRNEILGKKISKIIKNRVANLRYDSEALFHFTGDIMNFIFFITF